MKQLIIIFTCFLSLTVVAQEKNQENNILKNGFFIDGLIQGGGLDMNYSSPYGSMTMNQSASYSNFSAGLRLGNKWFFGEGKVYRPGIVANWIRHDILVNSYKATVTNSYGQNTTTQTYDYRPGQFFAILAVDPVNIGFSNVISFNDKMGLEIDITGGLSTVFIFENITSSVVNLAGVFGAAIKFRYKNLSVGLDFCHRQIVDLQGNSSYYNSYALGLNSIGLTIGGKF